MGADAWAVLELRDHGQFSSDDPEWVAFIGPNPLDCRDYRLFSRMLNIDPGNDWGDEYYLSESRGLPKDLSPRASEWFKGKGALGSGWLTLREAKSLVLDCNLHGSKLDTRAIPMMSALATTLELDDEDTRIVYHITPS